MDGDIMGKAFTCAFATLFALGCLAGAIMALGGLWIFNKVGG